MKKIYPSAEHVVKLRRMNQAASKAVLTKKPEAARLCLKFNAYIAERYPIVREYAAFGFWHDEKGSYIVCFESKLEHAKFSAEVLASGDAIAPTFGTDKDLRAS